MRYKLIRQETKKTTYTKKLVKIIMAVAIFDLQLSYILAYLGREEIAEQLSIVVVTSIIGVTWGYLAKSFFETKEEEKIKLEREKMEVWSNEQPKD